MVLFDSEPRVCEVRIKLYRKTPNFVNKKFYKLLINWFLFSIVLEDIGSNGFVV